MKRSFDTSALAQPQNAAHSQQDDRMMDIDEPNAYQVAMKRGKHGTAGRAPAFYCYK